MSFRHILFPVDFSDRCYHAAPFVQAVAARSGAAVTLLNVVEPPPAWAAAGDGGYAMEFDLPRSREEAEHRLAIFAAEAFPPSVDGIRPLELSFEVESGDPGGCISGLAQDWDADLIMLPTHGHGVFRRALLGSTTAKVLNDAHCAVWTGVHLAQPVPPERTGIHSIVCGLELDNKDSDLALLRYATALAADWGATVALVHAVPGTTARPDMYFDVPLESFLKDVACEQVAKLQAQAGTDFELRAEVGPVEFVMREAAIHFNADLAVIGRGVIGEFAGTLRTHAYGIMRESPCPVLSVWDRPA
jgi:nucleotide-binding universal stress UspA family protein